MDNIIELIEAVNELIDLNDKLKHRWNLYLDGDIENIDAGTLHHMQQVMNDINRTLIKYSTSGSKAFRMLQQDIKKANDIIKYFDSLYPQPPVAPDDTIIAHEY